jgi:CheY-like chemotaxis protein
LPPAFASRDFAPRLPAKTGGSARGTLDARAVVMQHLEEQLFAPPAAKGYRCLAGQSVLYVDDDADSVELMALILRDRGAIVTTARSATEAMVAVALVKFDVVITDIGLPLEDGYMLMRRIRALSTGAARVRAIALTGYAGKAFERRAVDAGFQLFLSKPIAPDDFVDAVAHLAPAA